MIGCVYMYFYGCDSVCAYATACVCGVMCVCFCECVPACVRVYVFICFVSGTF